jgi:hypothetical protein
MKLVFSNSLAPVKVGHRIVEDNGDVFVVSGWKEPQHINSAGRVWVTAPGGTAVAEYFPHVFNMKFVDE